MGDVECSVHRHLILSKGLRTRPMIIAHRGYSGIYPENTLIALREAIKLNVDGIEVDARITKDGCVILMHDETVDRTTNGSGKVEELTLEQIKALDAGSWKGEEFKGESIPTLSEALSCLPDDMVMYVEVKPSNAAREVISAIEEGGAFDRVVICSFHPSVLKMVSELRPHLPKVLIVGECQSMNEFKRLINVALECGANGLSIHYGSITAEFVKHAHQRAIGIVAWTVNDLRTLSAMLNVGVDAIATDYPDIVIKALGCDSVTD
ncbi:MAG: glycerophosphodiester phosphodiesterase family protein [Armatimonadota bacterium]|nr:hypothetical protein [Armatimonadota bacterium]MCX7777331.1 glycerophosphodiester phosphodiesterase family protein [Armatimonadota bacterium]MDW8024350.1 glycerophosphodiester phosphodiesterase family protein [Armatimonadota bacterium]